MFWQVAKRDSLSFGVGRAAVKSSDSPDRDLRLDAQNRECDGLIVFHAGKALETSLHIICAKANNRIPGREYPGASNTQITQIRRDRKSHSLTAMYDDTLKSAEAKPGLRKQLDDEFESIYQTAYHWGVQDFIVDEELVHRFFLVEDCRRSAKRKSAGSGAEPKSRWTTQASDIS